jgi:hypothetical protein
MKHSKKLEAFAQREIVNLASNLVLADGNRYFLFGRYELEKTDHSVQIFCRDQLTGVFSSTKTAVAWCVADKFNQLATAHRIQQLDQEYTRYTNDINIKLLQMSRSKSHEFKDTVSVKLAKQQNQCRAIETELSKCVKMAKYWQYRGFNNETQRISSATTY